MDEIFAGTKLLTLLTATAMLIVLAAMLVDLANGLWKAHIRGDAKRSYGLKRTMSKFVLYEGGMIIAYGIDLLIHFAHLWALVGVESLISVPVVTFLVAIFLLVVEGMSVHEKADEKIHSELRRTEDVIGRVADRLTDSILDALEERMRERIMSKEE